MKLIDKDALVAWAKETYLCENASMIRKVCYKQLLEHLDTLEVKYLQEESTGDIEAYQSRWGKSNGYLAEPVSEDLEEEIENYLKDSLAVKFPTTDVESIKADVRYIARHFAEWQKQQMMKNAVNGEVTYGKSLAIPSLGYFLDKNGLDFGDKVKMIIIKED